jgi:hypothetical protein
VYLLKGTKNEFYRYDPVADTWNVLPDAPVGANIKWDRGSWLVHDGAGTLYAHKAKYHEFYTFGTESNTWSPDSLHAMPRLNANGKSKKCGDGGCAAWFDGTITALKGGNTQELWRYTVSTNSWTELDTLPSNGSSAKKKKVKAGGSIASVGGNVFFAIKGNKTREFWRYHFVGGVGVREDCAPVELPAGGQGLSVVPNPTTGYATVRLPSLFAASSCIRVYDIRGNLVMERPAASFLRLDCRSLTPGVYFVHARNSHAQVTCRLVKE